MDTAVNKHQIKHWNGRVLFEFDVKQPELANRLVSACKLSESGCLEWQLHLVSGAGRMRHNGRPEYAHRLMYEAVHGVIPDGMLVRHDCDNRACINPDHLLLGTHIDNMADMVARGRSTKGRAPSAQHRERLSDAGRGRKHPEHVKQAISASLMAYRAAKRESAQK